MQAVQLAEPRTLRHLPNTRAQPSRQSRLDKQVRNPPLGSLVQKKAKRKQQYTESRRDKQTFSSDCMKEEREQAIIQGLQRQAARTRSDLPTGPGWCEKVI